MLALIALIPILYRVTIGPLAYVDVSPTAPPLPTCTDQEVASALEALPPYQLTEMTDFARLKDGRFMIADTPYYVRGVNYFPVRYPWRRYLTESGLDDIDTEFALLREAGFNTIRTFLWYDPMFICEGNGAIPDADVFMRLDGLIHAAAENNLRIILTLHDMPGFDYPLYSNPPHIQAQTTFIVERYRDEGAILAWDLRNEGDIEYGSRDGVSTARFPRWQVLDWLADTSELVRSLDSNHLITAGWLHDSEATLPSVDFLSFHHWWDADALRKRVGELQAASDKPILLEEFGYSTFRISEEEQAQRITEIIQATETDETLLGWMVWTAFDFPVESTCLPPACPDIENPEHHFGLWFADYTPKPAAEAMIEWIRQGG